MSMSCESFSLRGSSIGQDGAIRKGARRENLYSSGFSLLFIWDIFFVGPWKGKTKHIHSFVGGWKWLQVPRRKMSLIYLHLGWFYGPPFFLIAGCLCPRLHEISPIMFCENSLPHLVHSSKWTDLTLGDEDGSDSRASPCPGGRTCEALSLSLSKWENPSQFSFLHLPYTPLFYESDYTKTSPHQSRMVGSWKMQ